MSRAYNERLDADDQISAEEDIAALIHANRSCSFNEDTCAHLGRLILRLTLRRFRPDLFEGSEEPRPLDVSETSDGVVESFPLTLAAVLRGTSKWKG